MMISTPTKIKRGNKFNLVEFEPAPVHLSFQNGYRNVSKKKYKKEIKRYFKKT